MNENLAVEPCVIPEFSVVDHELVIGGYPIRQLAARVGSTPFFAYERRSISSRVAELRAALPREISLRYAVKANPMAAVVSHLSRLIDGFDVSSLQEMSTALDTGVPAADIGFSGPGKSEAEISCAVAAGVVLHLESERELNEAIAAGKKLDIVPKVAVRVNPDFEVRGSKLKMGGGSKPFGLDEDRVPALLKQIFAERLDFQGFHIFTGSQNLNAESVIDTLKNSLELGASLIRHAPNGAPTLTIGGGFGIPYFPGDKPLDLTAVGTALGEILPDYKVRHPETKLVIELGRYLVGEAGVYVCKIIDRKISRGQAFLIADGGMNHHLAASGHLGQVIRRNFPVAIGTRMDRDARETASIVGPLCTPLDLLADKVRLPRAEIGDLVVVFQSGAYGLTASPVNFLGHPPAREILV